MAVTVSMLSACQVMRTQQNVANTVQISCSGAESCEFSRLNDVLIINEKITKPLGMRLDVDGFNNERLMMPKKRRTVFI